MEAVLSAVAERHYDVRWQCAAAVDSASHFNSGDQYILLNANGLVVVGIAPSHSLFQSTSKMTSIVFPHASVFGGGQSPPTASSHTESATAHVNITDTDIPKAKRQKSVAAVETDAFGNSIRKREKPVRVQGGHPVATIHFDSGASIHVISPITAEIMDLNLRLTYEFELLLGSPATSCWDGWFAILNPISKEERNKLNQTSANDQDSDFVSKFTILTTPEYVAKHRSV